MKTRKQFLLAGVAIGAIMVVLFLGIGAAVSAFSSGRFAGFAVPGSVPAASLDEVIPLESVSDLTSLEATVKISVNGLIDGERAQGDLTGLLAIDEQGQSQITVSGSLLGDLATKVGGSLIGLFTPSKVHLYKVPEGAYVVVGGFIPMCIKPEALNATDTLDEMSPLSMLSMLTSSEVARGKLVGEETLNGAPVTHYVIDGDAFLAAAQNGGVAALQTEHGAIDGDVGACFIDDAQHADGNAAAREPHAVGQHPALNFTAHRVGQGDDLAGIGGEIGNAAFVEQQSVNQIVRQAFGLGILNIKRVGSENGRCLCLDFISNGEKGFIFLSGCQRRQNTAGRFGVLAHEGEVGHFVLLRRKD